MQTTVLQRIIELIKEKNLNQSQFASMINMEQRTVSNYLNGTRKLSFEFIESVIRTFELDANYLISGEETIDSLHVQTKLYDNSKLIPMIPFDAIAGLSVVDNAGVNLNECEKYLIPEFDDLGVEFIVRVSGNSMYPKYSSGDLIACRKVTEILFFQWGQVYVIDSSQGVMVKRLFEDVNNSDVVICHSDNKEFYPRFSIPKSDIRSLSLVVGLLRRE